MSSATVTAVRNILIWMAGAYAHQPFFNLARGRESEADIAARLKREAPLTAERAEIVTIMNDRSVAEAVDELLAVLRALARHGS